MERDDHTVNYFLTDVARIVIGYDNQTLPSTHGTAILTFRFVCIYGSLAVKKWPSEATIQDPSTTRAISRENPDFTTSSWISMWVR